MKHAMRSFSSITGRSLKASWRWWPGKIITLGAGKSTREQKGRPGRRLLMSLGSLSHLWWYTTWRGVEEMRRRTVCHVRRRRWTSTMLLITASILIPSSEISTTIVVVVWPLIIAVIVVHSSSHTSSVHTGRRGWDKARSHPASITRLLIVIEGYSRALVDVFFISIWKGWNHWIFLSSGADVSLLCRGQSHSPLLPIHDVFLVVKLEIFAELPTSPLLLSSRGTVMGQIGI